MNYAPYIREIARGPNGANDLSYADSQLLYSAILEGQVADFELGAIVTALRLKGESPDEMRGFADAAHQHSQSLTAPTDAPRPIVLPSYNGARKIPNLTPLLALAIQSFGVPVVIHCLEEGFGRVTSAQVFAELGVKPITAIAEGQAIINERGLALVPLSLISPGLARQLGLRERTGLRNSAHSLVKMLDPFKGQGVVVMAATHPEYMETMRETALSRGQQAILLRATEGEPFANPKRRPAIEFIHDGHTESLFEAEHDSLKSIPNLPEEPDAKTTADWIRRVMDGNLAMPQTISDHVAGCLYAAGYCETLADAVLALAGKVKTT
jgi:anthranilate phosphoribosyltransferase